MIVNYAGTKRERLKQTIYPVGGWCATHDGKLIVMCQRDTELAALRAENAELRTLIRKAMASPDLDFAVWLPGWMKRARRLLKEAKP